MIAQEICSSKLYSCIMNKSNIDPRQSKVVLSTYNNSDLLQCWSLVLDGPTLPIPTEIVLTASIIWGLVAYILHIWAIANLDLMR